MAVTAIPANCHMENAIQRAGGYDPDRMLPQSPLVKPGAVIAGRYELIELIGHGGMGTVWKAKHQRDGSFVALKFVSTAHMGSPDKLKRFTTEARAAASLRGRYVVTVFEHGELKDGTPFMAMELLQGTALSDYLARRAPLSLNETFRIVCEVGSALTMAHEQGIVHRDIKPENVFLCKEPGKPYEAKVLDFGVAKFLEGKGAAHSRTRTGVLVGTPLYMSPEQVRGLKTVDHRSDIYALGALTFAMLTGHEVFPEENFGELLFKICTAPLPDLSNENPTVPKNVNEWFHKSCAREPENRFDSVVAQVRALSTATGIPLPPGLFDELSQHEGESSASQTASSTAPGGKAPSGNLPGRATSHWRTVIVVVVGLVLVALAAWLSLQSSHSTKQTGSRRAPEGSKPPAVQE